jgi:1,4-alpha-glucan branching enzyme
MQVNLLDRKKQNFVLWAPGQAAPKLVIGTFEPGAPPRLANEQTIAMTAVAGVSGLWQATPPAAQLQEGRVYHYWFEVADTHPGGGAHAIRVADPTASTTDWRLYSGDQPSAVIKFSGGKLVDCDPDGTEVQAPANANPAGFAQNNHTVVYELPTAWTRRPRGGGVERGVGTFRDVLAMVERSATGANFDTLGASQPGRAHIAELGVNAIELLPPADSLYDREWGYGTSHMFAPDFELGCPEGHSWPTANQDLKRLVEACHQRNIRILVDIVMGFARSGPYQHIDFDDFHIVFDARNPPADPDAWSSRAGEARNDWGSRLFRYVKRTTTYDPITGQDKDHRPARHLQFAALERWMRDFHIDGYRIDSVETVANWDFLGDFTSRARQNFRDRCAAHGVSQNAADARFLVIGEELHLPLDIIIQGRVTSLWNDKFREYIRYALIGHAKPGESFESTVKKAVDCTRFGFSDGSHAVIYLGSHDVEGLHKERLATMFRYQFPYATQGSEEERLEHDRRQDQNIERRMKLAFCCLLTSVGIPMILAGDEFADEHDLFNIHGNVSHHGGKQIDPVNYSRLDGDDNAWRRNVLQFVKRLIEVRKTHAALGVNETKWLHVDIQSDRRILVWQRGPDDNPVVVVANFSDFESGGFEYSVPHWPRRDRPWRDVSQGRDVADGWAGRESLFPWEAKVYALR